MHWQLPLTATESLFLLDVDRCGNPSAYSYSGTLLSLLIASLFVWHRSTGSIAVDSINNPKSELFYWLTITFSQTLGTALGDWVADTAGLGCSGGIAIFGGLLAVVAILYWTRRVPNTALFW